MKVTVAPFYVPSAASISHGPWSYGDDSLPLPRLIEAWDYQAQLRLAAGMTLDMASLWEESKLKPTSRLQVLVIAKSSSTKIERCVLKLDLPQLDHYELTMEVVLDGAWMGGRLSLDTQVIAIEPIPAAPGSAIEPGSILWTARYDTVLEGHGGLFPTDTEDFSQTRPQHKDAPWVLSIDHDDLEALFSASVRLTLNSHSRPVAAMLADPNADEPIHLARVLELDITRQLALVALSSVDVLTRPINAESVDLGDVLRLLVSRIWPNVSTASLQGWRVDRPERLELDIQQFVRAFR